jgi:uncharacterized protein (TIGR00369 family)
MVETTASVGAAIWLGEAGRPVGIANSTDFLRPVREGELRAEATPVNRGRSTSSGRSASPTSAAAPSLTAACA